MTDPSGARIRYYGDSTYVPFLMLCLRDEGLTAEREPIPERRERRPRDLPGGAQAALAAEPTTILLLTPAAAFATAYLTQTGKRLSDEQVVERAVKAAVDRAVARFRKLWPNQRMEVQPPADPEDPDAPKRYWVNF